MVAEVVKLPTNECHGVLLMPQVNICASADQIICRHLVSPGNKDLSYVYAYAEVRV